jgi:hypothetical protein
MSDWYLAETETSGQNRKDTELSANQQKALSALLTHPSIEAAAKSCGLTERTLRRYLKENAFFRDAYREARDELFAEAVGNLRRIAIKAIAGLESAIDDPDVNVRIRAYRSILDYLFKGVDLERKIKETEELEQRIAALEDPHRDRGGW